MQKYEYLSLSDQVFFRELGTVNAGFVSLIISHVFGEPETVIFGQASVNPFKTLWEKPTTFYC